MDLARSASLLEKGQPLSAKHRDSVKPYGASAFAFADDCLAFLREDDRLLGRSKSAVKPPNSLFVSVPGPAFGTAYSPKGYGTLAAQPRLSAPGVLRADALRSGRSGEGSDVYEAARRGSKQLGARSGSEANISSKTHQDAKTLHALLSPVNSLPAMFTANKVKGFPGTFALYEQEAF